MRAAFLLAAVTVWLFLPALADGKSLWYRDVGANFLPNHAYWHERVFQGELPHWNPYSGGGMPFAADPVQGTFYPLKALMLLSSDPVAGFNLLVGVHFFLLAIGMYRMLRSFGTGEPAALLGSLTALLGGVTANSTILIQFLYAQTWLPWMLEAANAFAKDRRFRSGMMISIFGSLILLAAEPQTFIISLGILFVFWLCVPGPAGDSRGPAARMAQAVSASVLYGSLAIGCSLIQWLPAAYLAGESIRATEGLPLPLAEACSFAPIRFLELVIPRVFGDDVARYTVWDPALACSDLNPTFYLSSIYIGAVPVVFTAFAFGWNRIQPLAKWALLVALLSGVIALGHYSPLDFYSVLFHWLPTWNRFRFPERLLPFFVLGLTVLASIGFDRFWQAETFRDWTAKILLGIAMCVALLAFLIPWSDLLAGGPGPYRGWAKEWIEFTAVHFKTYSAGLVLVILTAVLANSRWALIAAVPLLVADLSWNASHLVNFQDNARLFRDRPQVAVYLDRFRDGPASPPVHYSAPDQLMIPRSIEGIPDAVLTGEYRVRGLALDSQILWGHSASKTGNTMVSARIEELRRVLDDDRYEAVQGSVVKVVSGTAEMPGRTYGEPVEVDGFRLFPLAKAGGRVLCPVRWTGVNTDTEALGVMAGPDRGASFDPEASAVVEGRTGGERQTPATVCGVTRWSEEEYDLEVNQLDDGPVVLRELHSAGWTASLENGRPLQVYPANHIHQAVFPGAGHHRITFRYRTPGLVTGAVLSALTLAGMGVAAFCLPRRRPEDLPEPSDPAA